MDEAPTSGLGSSVEPSLHPGRSPLRWLFLALGFVFVGLGALGVALPGLPTTPFMLLAAWMFSKSSARFHAWLWNHQWFGKYVRDWEQHRVIPLKAKLLSSSVMTLGVGMMLARGTSWLITLPTIAVCIFGAAFVWRCPSHSEAVETSPAPGSPP